MRKEHDAYPLGLRPVANRNARLRHALESGLVVAPGSYDCITARLVQQAGFPATYMTGSGISMSALGAPDLGLMSFSEVLDRARMICSVTEIPVIADIDTGYGGPLNVIRCIREMEAAGVSAVQIEDQVWPKKCGHENGRQLASTSEMTGRIKAAVDARLDPDFLIIARTDARTTEGIDAAIDRANLYAEAGADILFVESPETTQEMRKITEASQKPTLANMVEGGRTPILSVQDLEMLGFRVAIYPNSLTRTVARMGQIMLRTLREEGSLSSFSNHMLDHRALWDLFDYKDWTLLEDRFQTKE